MHTLIVMSHFLVRECDATMLNIRNINVYLISDSLKESTLLYSNITWLESNHNYPYA